MSSPILDLIEENNDRMNEILRDLEEVSTTKIGLDIRAGHVFVSHEGIIAHNQERRVLDYYGGFEYVSKEHVHVLGDYTFYSRYDDRVEEAVRYYMGEQDEAEEDTEEEI